MSPKCSPNLPQSLDGEANLKVSQMPPARAVVVAGEIAVEAATKAIATITGTACRATNSHSVYKFVSLAGN